MIRVILYYSMSTLSVPLPTYLDEFIVRVVRRGDAANKADVVRRALLRMAEDDAVLSVLRAEQEVKDGRAVSGNLRKILKRLP